MPWDWVSQALTYITTRRPKLKQRGEPSVSTNEPRPISHSETVEGLSGRLAAAGRADHQRLQAYLFVIASGANVCKPAAQGSESPTLCFCVLRCVQRTAQRLTMKRNIYRLFKSQQMVVTRRNEFQQIFLTLSSGTDFLGGFPQRGWDEAIAKCSGIQSGPKV